MNKAVKPIKVRGRRLAFARKARRMSQRQLAQRTRLAAKTIWSAEQGLPCQQMTKRRILKGLGISFAKCDRFFVSPRNGRKP